MNYRHAFHAGNFADVFKHVILTRILVYLMRKDAPIRVIDTHAGEGLYDLSAASAEKTGEWRAGIGRIIAAPPPPAVAALLEPYLAIVAPLLDGAPPLYPGSPALAMRLLRPRDRMIFCDAHPEVVAALRALNARERDRRVKVVEIDGYRGLNAFVPPPERRGLVLIDPPFESKTEFDQLQDALASAARKWPTGIYMVWFPVKDSAAVERFLGAVAATGMGLGMKNMLHLQLAVGIPGPEAPLAACGLIILNPPYTLEVEARAILPYLAQTMTIMGRCDTKIAWLARD